MEIETSNAIKSLSEQALRDLYGNLTQAKGFVLEQAPDFCRQLITRDIAIYVCSSIICGLVAIVCLIIFFRCFKSRSEGAQVVGCTLSSILGAVLFAVSCTNAVQALSIYLAPKVYLVEQIAKMIK